MRTTTERILADLRPLWRRRGENFIYRWQWGQQSYVEGTMARITSVGPGVAQILAVFDADLGRAADRKERAA